MHHNSKTYDVLVCNTFLNDEMTHFFIIYTLESLLHSIFWHIFVNIVIIDPRKEK